MSCKKKRSATMKHSARTSFRQQKPLRSLTS